MNVYKYVKRDSLFERICSIFLLAILLTASATPSFAQSRVLGVRKKESVKRSAESERERERERLRRSQKTSPRKPKLNSKGEIVAEKIVSDAPVVKTTLDLMSEQSLRGDAKTTRQLLWEKGIAPEFEGPDRKNLPQNPNAPSISEYPALSKAEKQKLSRAPNLVPSAPQPIGLDFNAASLSDAGAFPPDTMGAVGPSQFVAFINGRIRTFTKAGVADGVINADPDVFFASVMTPVTGSVVLNFTSDPNVRYDRLTGRWILTIIDVPCTNATCTTTAPNRILIAVSDAASSAAITPGTVWTFFQFQGDAANFSDYTSLGVDANALYIGANMFNPAGSFVGTDGWVVPKSTVLGAGPLTSWHFIGLVGGGTGSGPFSPRGVDNFDPSNTGPTATGYFIGVDNATFSTLMVRRVTDPSNTVSSPMISSNLAVTVPTTTFPNPVTHAGNTGGNNGRLDSLDDRLYAAVVRNGRLWTAHNFRVSATGVASTTSAARNAIRWYELQNLNTTPTLVQSGTVFDSAATLGSARQYWIPSITVTGQGHAAIGSSTAGTLFNINAFTTGRLSGDTLGTMRGTAAGYTSSSTAYNPPSDPGGASGRRWGDYSFTSVDPLDDMTIWTIQQYCDATNSYGVRVAKLLAPPPASIADGPNAGGVYNVIGGQASFNVTITGTSVNGSGFFDPGANLGGNARPYNHISASVSGTNVVVNSITYNSPTSLTLNLNTSGASVSDPLVPETLRDLTITNPDGQSVTRSAIISVQTPTAANVFVAGRVLTSDGQGISRAIVTMTNAAGESRSVTTNTFGFYRFDNVPAGGNYVLTVGGKKYQFAQPSIVVTVADNLENQDFVALP